MAKRGGGKGQSGRNAQAPVIVRRTEEVADAGHHGGAWKIAYADFVTAMMAFFLLMWLVNATTEAQRRGIADYFAPNNPMGRVTTGSGQPFGGRTLASEGQMISDGGMQMPLARTHPRATDEDLDDEGTEPDGRPAPAETQGGALQSVPVALAGQQALPPPESLAPAQAQSRARAQADAQAQQEAGQQQRDALHRVGEELRAAVRADPQLAGLANQLLIEVVPEGLRIQLVDDDGQAIFATGQAAPNERGRALLQRVAGSIARLADPVEITGHTDAAPFRGAGPDGRSNWELSVERANATRRLLLEAGIAEARLRGVAGRADRDLLRPESPLDPANRRVAVLVLIPTTPGNAAAATSSQGQIR
jgi:chemotaxis protein MotB